MVLHNIVQKIGDRDGDMNGWEDNEDLPRMDLAASTASQRAAILRLELAQRTQEETDYAMRASGKQFREALCDVIVPRE